MIDSFFEALGEVGLEVGIRLIGRSAQPADTIDRTALANAIVRSAIEQAGDIARQLGVARAITAEQFGVVAGGIAVQMMELVQCLTGADLSMQHDVSLNIGAACMEALIAVRK